MIIEVIGILNPLDDINKWHRKNIKNKLSLRLMSSLFAFIYWESNWDNKIICIVFKHFFIFIFIF